MVRPIDNPPNPWLSSHVDYLGPPPDADLVVYEEEVKSVLSRNDSPDLPFTWSVNPYRGCFHACAYCYARPTHEYLGFGAGTDFERRIVVKTNAPDVLDQQLRRRSWHGERIAFSGVTDCYQPLEASYRVTRRCLEVCLRHRNPVGIVTKGALVERDADLLAELSRVAGATVWLSIPYADDALGRAIEPFAAPPSRRLRSLATLADAGVRTAVAVAPLIPGLNDAEMPAVLRAAAEAGAQAASLTMLRLPGPVAGVFEQRLQDAAPLRYERVMANVHEMRGGRRNETRFGDRMRGCGARWEMIARLFELECRRLGLAMRGEPLAEESAPKRPRQLGLFEPQRPGSDT
ncbi:MAG: PA0069 family radical SAM protein [Planctomycetota bacterium]